MKQQIKPLQKLLDKLKYIVIYILVVKLVGHIIAFSNDKLKTYVGILLCARKIYTKNKPENSIQFTTRTVTYSSAVKNNKNHIV